MEEENEFNYKDQYHKLVERYEERDYEFKQIVKELKDKLKEYEQALLNICLKV